MKLLVPTSLFLAASLMVAQGPPRRPAADHMATMTTLLSLDAGQQAQAKKVYADAQTATKTIRTSMRTAHTSLAAAVKSNDIGSIETLTSQIGVLQAQELSINSKAEAAFYATLSADQKTKYDTLHHGGPGGFGGGPGGPGGPRGPRGN